MEIVWTKNVSKRNIGYTDKRHRSGKKTRFQVSKEGDKRCNKVLPISTSHLRSLGASYYW